MAGPDAPPAPAPDPVAGPMVPVRHRVAGVRRDLPDTVTLTLVPDGRPLAPFTAGQFNMVWAFGKGEVPISVSGAAARQDRIEHTVRAVGPSTAALCALRLGDVVGLRGPFGTSWRPEDAAGGDLLVVAGGLGLAPLRPVVLHALAHRAGYRRVVVLIGSRAPDALLYGDEIAAWRAGGELDVWVTVDHADRGWWGEVGLVTRLLDRVTLDPPVTRAMVCGPELMMRLTARDLVDRGLAASAVQVSLERNMKCAVAHCGHCQLGPTLVCRDGAVLPFDVAGPLMAVRGR